MAYLAFESGGTKLVAALADDSARLLTRTKAFRSSGQTAQETLDQLCQMGEGLLSAQPGALRAIGYGFGGPVARARGQPLASLTEPGWSELRPCEILSTRFGAPAFIENDCNSAALGEALFGAGRDATTVFYVTIGTGCGGGLVRNGNIVALADSGEAEFGHIVVDPDGPLCPCGNTGCIEAICAGPAIARRSRSLHGDLFADARAIFRAFLAGDPRAVALVQETARRLGQGLGIVCSLLNPDVIIVGGGIAQAGEPLLERIREYTARNTFSLFRGRARIVLSQLGEDAVCQGAAAYAKLRVAGG